MYICHFDTNLTELELKAVVSVAHGGNFRHTGALAVESNDKRRSDIIVIISCTQLLPAYMREIGCVENGEIVAITIGRF